MEITCVKCKQTWQVPAGQILAARIKFGLGFIDHAFICPNCHTKNIITATEFKSSDHPSPLVPITGAHDHSATLTHHPPRADNDGAPAPTNPVPGPEPNARQIHAVVLQRGVPLLREHNPMAETMATLSKGEKIIILDKWTDGVDTWVQLGPERWTTIERDGEVLVEVIED